MCIYPHVTNQNPIEEWQQSLNDFYTNLVKARLTVRFENIKKIIW